MKVRLLVLAMGAVALGGALSAPPLGASAPTQSTYSLASLRHMLIARADLPRGWRHATTFKPIDGSCSPIAPRQQLLGTNSVEALLAYPSQQAVAFEYLAYRTDVVDAFQHADTSIYTFGSCHLSTNGTFVDAAINDGTIETRTFGTWSDADRYSYNVRGAKYQLGYMVVRDKDFLLIVGFGNRGALKLTTMEGLTEKALANLPAS